MTTFAIGFIVGAMAAVWWIEFMEHRNDKWTCNQCGATYGEQVDEYA